MSSPNWLPDPSGRHQLRWWDGTAWTENVSDNGVTALDPADAAWTPPAPAPMPSMTSAGYTAPENHPKTTTIFVLGLLGILCCGILGPFAWVMGNTARRETAADPTRYAQNNGLLTAGWILGIIATVFLILSVLYVALVFLGAASFSVTSG